ncbi:MAG: hypothetical protein JXR36_03020 [Bacteroidales bacterium]|nr:hypothetical protein [Bacteroidales bacterium]
MKNNYYKNLRLNKLKSFTFIVILVFMTLNSFGQTVTNFETIKPVAEKDMRSGSSDLYSLYYDNHSSLLISAEKSVSSDSNSENRVLEINVSNLNLVSEKSFNLNSIELIRVIYNQADQPATLDLSKISSLSNLKAIVFQCDFNCTPSQIQKLIAPQNKNDIPIYYLVSIPQ